MKDDLGDIPDAPLFAFDHVSVTIDARPVLTDLTAEVPPRGITVVVGPSGSGKTTFLRLLNRLTVPDSGMIQFRGEPLDAIDPLTLRRRVGMVFQIPTPFAGSVRDNLRIAQDTADDGAMEQVLRTAGLAPSFLDRDAQELSGGEAQRICVARTLITQPEVLLLDEPTSALDVDQRLALERRMRQIADAGTPIVWVTHDLEQARRVGDAWIVLVEGRLGTADEAHRYMVDEALPSEMREESGIHGDH